jgi:hypothetical protein
MLTLNTSTRTRTCTRHSGNRNRLPDHDVQVNRFLGAGEHDVEFLLEPEFLVVGDVCEGGGFEVCWLGGLVCL